MSSGIVMITIMIVFNTITKGVPAAAAGLEGSAAAGGGRRAARRPPGAPWDNNHVSNDSITV